MLCRKERLLILHFSSFALLSKSSLQMTCRSSPSFQPRQAVGPCPAPSRSLPLTATAPVGAGLLVRAWSSPKSGTSATVNALLALHVRMLHAAVLYSDVEGIILGGVPEAQALITS